MEGGRGSRQSARPPVSVPSAHPVSRIEADARTREGGVHVEEEWVPHPRMRGRGMREGAGGCSWGVHVIFRVSSSANSS